MQEEMGNLYSRLEEYKEKISFLEIENKGLKVLTKCYQRDLDI